MTAAAAVASSPPTAVFAKRSEGGTVSEAEAEAKIQEAATEAIKVLNCIDMHVPPLLSSVPYVSSMPACASASS